MAGSKATVTNILLDRIIKTAEESGKLPWENPCIYANAFNYFTHHEYRGINRWLLPQGEYMTKTQINNYNEKHGTNYRFAKGIKWEYVLFCKSDEKEFLTVSEEVPAEIRERAMQLGGSQSSYVFIGFAEGYTWYSDFVHCLRRRVIRTYHKVAERRFFVDENGECLPSKIELGEVIVTKQEPETVLQNYLTREGIPIRNENLGTAFYNPTRDYISLPPDANFKTTDAKYSTAFHEAGHSTGHEKRLNRAGITDYNPFGSKGYSREELVAELCSALCCAETGIQDYSSQHQDAFENHTAYVQNWLNAFKRFKTSKDGSDDIVYICSDAEKAFQYILSATDKDLLDDLRTGKDGSGGRGDNAE